MGDTPVMLIVGDFGDEELSERVETKTVIATDPLEALRQLVESSVDVIFIDGEIDFSVQTLLDRIEQLQPSVSVWIRGDTEEISTDLSLRRITDGSLSTLVEQFHDERQSEQAIAHQQALSRAIDQLTPSPSAEAVLSRLIDENLYAFGFEYHCGDTEPTVTVPIEGASGTILPSAIGASDVISEACNQPTVTAYPEGRFPLVTVPLTANNGVILVGRSVDSVGPSAQATLARLTSSDSDDELSTADFGSMVEHELRNPLDMALGRLELAISEGDDVHIERAMDAIEQMAIVVGAVSTLSREKPVKPTETVSLGPIAGDVWETISNSNASLEIEDEPTILADRHLLERLLSNLFRNAIHHAGTSVTVTVGALGSSGFYVEDDGPGIPSDQREMVKQAGVSLNNGSGFGLAIVDRVAQLHNWEWSITEAEGGGARFEFRPGP